LREWAGKEGKRSGGGMGIGLPGEQYLTGLPGSLALCPVKK